jgi:hypothetical protein
MSIVSFLSGLVSIFNKVFDYFREKALIDQGRVQQKAEDNAKALDDVKTANDAAADPYVVDLVRQSLRRD